METSKSSFGNNLKEVFNNWIESSTVHGLPNIFRSKNTLLKLFWILCFLASSGFCIYQFTQILIEFFEFRVNTKISYERQASIEFPTVSFCNKNPFNLRKKDNSIQNLMIEIEALKNNISSFNLRNENTFETLVDLDFHFPNLILKYEENLSNISYNLNEMIVNCEFNILNCGNSNFEHFTIPNFGNCYKFNSGRNIKSEAIAKQHSKIPGKRYGLRLELFTGFLDHNDLIKSGGIHLFIHNHSTVIFSEYDSISLSNGFETDIVVSQEHTTKLSKPYSDCIKDPTSLNSFHSDLYKKTINFFGRYQQKTCLIMCYNEYIKQQCGCYYPTSLQAKYITSCKDTQMTCSQEAFFNFIDSNETFKCFEFCPDECETFNYKSKISFSEFPSPYYAELVLKNPTNKKKWNFTSHESIKRSVVAVNVFHDDIGLTLIQESASMNYFLLICNLGGILGICVGMSILSVIEFMDFIFKILFVSIKKTKSSMIRQS